MGNQHQWDVFSLRHKKSGLRTATSTKTTNLRQIQFANLERLNDCQGAAHFVCFADKPTMLENMELLAMSTFTLYNEVINVCEQKKRGEIWSNHRLEDHGPSIERNILISIT